jgi:hypothetical protein
MSIILKIGHNNLSSKCPFGRVSMTPEWLLIHKNCVGRMSDGWNQAWGFTTCFA